MDLNQQLNLIKSRQVDPKALDAYRTVINKYEKERLGPICCFYIKPLRNVYNWNGYIDLANFINLASTPDEVVVGCSRGCLPRQAWSGYGEKLCKGCVEEAKRYLNDSTR